MSTLDGQDLFGSGPHAIAPGSWQRDIVRRSYSGISGETVIDQGKRSREIRQTGRLQAADVASLQANNHGKTFSRVIMESFHTPTGIRRGRGYWCDYEITYRQLP